MKLLEWIGDKLAGVTEREKMHAEIGVLIAAKRDAEARIADAEKRLEEMRNQWADAYTSKCALLRENEYLRKLISSEAEAKKLAEAVGVLKDFMAKPRH